MGFLLCIFATIVCLFFIEICNITYPLHKFHTEVGENLLQSLTNARKYEPLIQHS
jgi:hypothetical protein